MTCHCTAVIVHGHPAHEGVPCREFAAAVYPTIAGPRAELRTAPAPDVERDDSPVYVPA